MDAAGHHHRPQLMERTKVLAYKAQWAKETELREDVKRLKSEGKKPSVQLGETSEEASQMRTSRWRWIQSQESAEKKGREAVVEN